MREIFISSEKKNMRSPLNRVSPYIVLLTLFFAAALLRPLLPVDETRYMTVAWEMYLKKDYLLPSLNFEPYHHKPPMLFWLINIAWNVFGVSRWAGLVPIFMAAAAVMALTQKLASDLFPHKETIAPLIPWMVLGSAPFLLYSTLVMFDLMVTAVALSTLLVIRDQAKNPRLYKIILAGFLMAAGVLTKGPVLYIYILSPLLLFPLWKDESHRLSLKKYYASLAFAVLLSALPVLAWILCAVSKADGNFAFWLVWEQTAGRITGNFSAAHVRPFYFYFMIVPILFLPWAFFPALLKTARRTRYQTPAYKFLACAVVPAFACFCMISGKQPHYLLPLLPYVLIFMGSLMAAVPLRHVYITALLLSCLLIAGQAFASIKVFEKYDMGSVARFYTLHRDADWAFVRHYQGQIGFLGKIEKRIDDLQMGDVDIWLKNHPDGYIIIRYNPAKEDLGKYQIIMTIPHKEKMISIV